jgi:hypothetical protein
MKTCGLFAIFAALLPAQIPNLGAPPAAATAPEKLPGTTVVATVKGVNVTIDDIRRMADTAPLQVLRYLQQDPQGFVRQMFLFRYLTEEGDKLKLGEQSPLKEQLEAQRGWVIANAMVGHEEDAYQVSETDLNNFYQKNQARWQQAKIKAIFVGFKPGAASLSAADSKDLEAAAKSAFQAAHPANERPEDEAKKLAADIIKQLRAGADFGKLVEQYSDDSMSKSTGGEFPPIKATSPYPDDLKKAIFALNNGDISEPIQQPSGFYIIRMDEKSVQPVNDVRDNIIRELRQTHRDQWLNDLNRGFTPTIQNPEFFLQPQLYIPQAAPAKQ